LALQVSHYIGERIVFGKLPNEVDVVGHDDEAVQSEPVAKTKAIKGIEDYALDRIALEDLKVTRCLGGDEVEVVWIEVGFPGGHGSFPVRRIWQSATALDLATPHRARAVGAGVHRSSSSSTTGLCRMEGGEPEVG
jgi:hypothetical protein